MGQIGRRVLGSKTCYSKASHCVMFSRIRTKYSILPISPLSPTGSLEYPLSHPKALTKPLRYTFPFRKGIWTQGGTLHKGNGFIASCLVSSCRCTMCFCALLFVELCLCVIMLSQNCAFESLSFKVFASSCFWLDISLLIYCFHLIALAIETC